MRTVKQVNEKLNDGYQVRKAQDGNYRIERYGTIENTFMFRLRDVVALLQKRNLL